MRDKGTNELRVNVTDLTDAVLNWKVGLNSDLSKNSIVCRVLDKWAREVVMKTLRKQDKVNLSVKQLKIHGVNLALFRRDPASDGEERSETEEKEETNPLTNLYQALENTKRQ
ncbi:hypothetical protein [Parasutterella sp.]|jgi:hypothetical protein|uniref:hypothetical protein n=1 Tax=Parasutterella sp. TaxID=2049037 RepID=UPI00205F0D1D|nr:MAG TPA: hypothetical protein [Caudoviricetes sp.]